MKELLINILAALICFLAGATSRTTWTAARKALGKRRTRRMIAERVPRYSRPWLVEYYGECSGQLYRFQLDGQWRPTQLLMRDSWTLDGGVTDDDLLDQTLPQRRSAVKVRRRIVKRKGAHIDLTDAKGEEWNDLIASVAGIVTDDAGTPRIKIQLAEYYQFLTSCFPLEHETYRAIRRSRWGVRSASPLRDRLFSSIDVAERCLLGAQPIGIQAATVFMTDHGPKILIQQRAVNVSSYGGALAVVPVFGCQTNDLTDRTGLSLFHNFLREVYEELYGGVDVERRSSHVDCFWFYRTPPIERILEAKRSKLVDWRLLGFGFDALNAELDIMALALFRRGRFTDQEFSEMRGNWEINRIQALDLFGDELTDLIRDDEFSAGSVYAIVETRKLLSEGFGGDA